MSYYFKKFIIIFFIMVLIFIYLKNDGLYVISNINLTEIEMINKYTSFDFPEDTIIEYFLLDDDIESFFLNHNECIHATLLIPNEKIEKIFPERLREYNKDYILEFRREESDEDIDFGVWFPVTVVKWLDKTQRTINFTVMKADGDFTRVYVFVDKLGWNIFKK